MLKIKNNNQAMRDFIEETCVECGRLNEFKNEYKLQKYIRCDSKILPGNHKSNIKITKIHEIHNANEFLDLYDF